MSGTLFYVIYEFAEEKNEDVDIHLDISLC